MGNETIHYLSTASHIRKHTANGWKYLVNYIIRHSKFIESNKVYEKLVPISGIKPALKKEWDEKKKIS